MQEQSPPSRAIQSFIMLPKKPKKEQEERKTDRDRLCKLITQN